MESPYHGGRISPSFAQTQEEFRLDDSDEDERDGDGDSDDGDLRLREHELAADGEAYELQDHRPGVAAGGEGHGHANGWAGRGDDVGARSSSPSPLPGTRRRLSASTVASFQLYTPDEEQVVVRKFDRRLVVFLALLYMLAFVDRSSTSTGLLSLCSRSTGTWHVYAAGARYRSPRLNL